MDNRLIVKGEGVPDFVLMDTLTEDAMMDNIRVRFRADRIYTYIGNVVVSMNPYKKIDIYGKNKIEEYRGRFMYEMPPHIFALSNNVYKSMLQNQENQCVIISGESGAGKTEASKIFMNYIAAVSKSSTEVDRVKSQLLESNPVLEAFGNAKTIRNDNSSRFGKYMEIQFEKDGSPVGGRINIYLLEKSRVITRAVGERSFHIFYQMLSGMSAQELSQMGLNKDANHYNYLKLSNCVNVDGVNDTTDWKIVNKAMDTLGFTSQVKNSMWRILGGILLLGNVTFADDSSNSKTGQTQTKISNPQVVDTIANLFQCDANILKRALTYRSISTGVGKRGSLISVPLDVAQANFTRDALAKASYERLFIWMVEHINKRLACKSPGSKLVIGILDIYGFEIFENNSFEQFCINLCNEKLQQLFIELTLKSEQEEYVREGIKWEPIKYFNNQIICNLIEGKPMGIISLLDECCLIAESTDKTFLEKLNTNFKTHPHYQSYTTTNDRSIGETHFRLKHYAGDVTYNVNGILEKNKDTLFVDLIQTMQTSRDQLVQNLFPPIDLNSKKRPLTAGTQFKNALAALMEKLLACEPHYIRCIKSNDQKRAGYLDEERVRHQVRYLGLLENVRVRRAGFAYRQTYDRFLWRYKMITKETWPRWNGDAKSGTQQIINSIGIRPDEYRMGKTKVFIRNPITLFSLEDRREQAMPRIVTMMQAAWRGYCARSKWAQRKAAIQIQLFYRKYRFRRWFWNLEKAFRGVDKDPNWGKYVNWPQHPSILEKSVAMLHRVHANWRARKMITALTPEQQAHMRQKVLSYDIFKGKKPWNIPRHYDADYLEKDTNPFKDKYLVGMQNLFATYGDTQVMFADYSNKINNKGKSQKRGIVVTEKNIYKHDPKNYKVKKFGTPLAEVTSISLSPRKDSFVVVHCRPPYRDLVLDLGIDGVDKYSEFVTVIVQEIRKLTGNTISVTFSDQITYNNSRDKNKPGVECTLGFQPNTDPKATGNVFKPGKNNYNQVLY